MNEREVVVEHYRRTPTTRDFVRARAKHGFRPDQWIRSAAPYGDRALLLLMLCGGQPRSVLRFEPALQHWCTRSVYRMTCAVGDIIIVAAKNCTAAPAPRCSG